MNSSGEMPSNRPARARAIRSRPSSPIAAVSPAEQRGELRASAARLGSSADPGLQRVDEEVELDVRRALAPQGAVVVEAGDPLLAAARRARRRGTPRRRRGWARAARRAAGRQVMVGLLRCAGVGPSHAPEADVAHAGVDHLRPAGGRPVAQAVGVGAQVRAALDHLAADPELRLGAGRSSPRGRRRAGSPARSRACRRRRGAGWSTSRRSTPRRCRPCRRARSRWPGSCRPARCATKPLSPGAAPGEVGPVPGVGHDPSARAGPRRPRCTPCPRGRRGRRTPTRPRSAASAPAQVAYASASSWATCTTGWSGRRSTELPGPSGAVQQAPGRPASTTG